MNFIFLKNYVRQFEILRYNKKLIADVIYYYFIVGKDDNVCLMSLALLPGAATE